MSSEHRDVEPTSLNSFDTGAWGECRRRADVAASRRCEDQYEARDAAPTSLNSFDTGAWREYRRRADLVARRQGEESVWLLTSGGRRRVTSNARSVPVWRNGRRGLRHCAPSWRVQWHFVLKCHARASPRGRHDTKRIESHPRLFWARERVVSLQKWAAHPVQQADHGAFDEKEESKRPRTSLPGRAFERNSTPPPVVSLSRSKV
jgi:hypothetical protein